VTERFEPIVAGRAHVVEYRPIVAAG